MDKTIGQLPAADELTDATLLPVEQSGTAKRVTGEQIKDYLGGSGSGLTDEAKAALLNCFSHVAWIDEDGQDYYDALYDALYPPANLVSISATFSQGSATIYDTDSLDTLRQYLTVTAHYSDSTSANVTAYTLSGTLAVGTSVITVSYGGKTTTFNVTVTEYVEPYISTDATYPFTATWSPSANTYNLSESLGQTGDQYRLEITVDSISSQNAYIIVGFTGAGGTTTSILFNGTGETGATGKLTKVFTIDQYKAGANKILISCNKGTETANQTAVISDIRIYEVS